MHWVLTRLKLRSSHCGFVSTISMGLEDLEEFSDGGAYEFFTGLTVGDFWRGSVVMG